MRPLRQLQPVLLAAILVVASASPAAAQSLDAYVTGQLGQLSAKTSIYAKHLPSGRTIAVRADVPMNTLSVIKIPVMILAFRDAEAGKLDLTARYTIRPEDLRRGSGLLQTFDIGLNPTHRDLIEQMIITSDNTATDIMIGVVGRDRVNAMLAELGFKETRLLRTTGDLFREVWIAADAKNRSMTDREVYTRGFPGDAGGAGRSFALEGDSSRWLGRTTAREMAVMLEGIVNATYASKASSDAMLGILRRQLYASRLPQRLMGKASVAHKTGDWPPIAGNDVGVLTYPGGPSIVSVFTNQNTGDFFELEATLGRIAERVVESWR
ncbi:MAG: serine hydrolase [Gemmatimonadaceae bacterium]|nr:serine hydrolase [Gemmatimonadaceae bacterium]